MYTCQSIPGALVSFPTVTVGDDVVVTQVKLLMAVEEELTVLPPNTCNRLLLRVKC